MRHGGFFINFVKNFPVFRDFKKKKILFVWETSLIAQGPQGVPPPPAIFFSNLTREFQAVNYFVFISPIFDATHYVRVTFCNKKVVLVEGETPT